MGKVKQNKNRILKDNQYLCDTVSVFDNPEASTDEVAKAGDIIILSVYGTNKTNCLGIYSFYAYKRVIANMPVKSMFRLSILLPTTDVAPLHLLMVFLQVHTGVATMPFRSNEDGRIITKD